MKKDDVINSVQVGDIVIAELEVTDVDSHSGNIRWGDQSTGLGWIQPKHVIEHKPKPFELKAGMRIDRRFSIATIQHIYDDTVWVSWSDGSHGLHPKSIVEGWARQYGIIED